MVSQHVLQVSRPTPREEVEAEGSGQDGFCTEADPPGRRLLLRVVSILLECILVINFLLLA